MENLDKEVLEGGMVWSLHARFLHGEEGLLLRRLVWDKGAGRQRARFFALPAFPPFSLQPFLPSKPRSKGSK